ncbi:MAG: hypothetical protein ABID87_06900 [Chloroflexota bacterium]
MRDRDSEMRDRGLDIMLVFFFGISGMVVLLLAWLRPLPLPDRLFTSAVGAFGLIPSGFRAFRIVLKSGINREKAAVAVKVRDGRYRAVFSRVLR